MSAPKKLTFKVIFEEEAEAAKTNPMEGASREEIEAFERHVAEKYPERRADDEDGGPLFDPENPDGYVDRDPLYDIACDILPARPVIRATLDNVYDINFINLVTAGILEQNCRGKLDDDTVDRLVAAALIARAKNSGEMAAYLPPGTGSLAGKLSKFLKDPILKDGAALTRDEICLYEAYLIAKLDSIHKANKIGQIADCADINLAAVPELLAGLSQVVPADIGQGFTKRAKDSFNAVAESLDLPQQLEMNKDNTLCAKPRDVALVYKKPKRG